MSTLTLVRHGQARSFDRQEGVLSPLGEAQAATLARHWLTQRVTFDEVYTGSLTRHIQTEAAVARCFREAGQAWPAAVCDSAWDEYDVAGVLASYLPCDSRLAALAAEYESARGTPQEHRRFHRLLEAAMLRWLEDPEDAAAAEPWPAFRSRVSGAIRALLAGPPGRRVAVFTSGGPIGFSVHFALQAPARSFLDVNWRIRNCSLTEFLFDRGRFALDAFNAIAHLDSLDLRTFR